jgi:hypothetical protein
VQAESQQHLTTKSKIFHNIHLIDLSISNTTMEKSHKGRRGQERGGKKREGGEERRGKGPRMWPRGWDDSS